jgi:hypothetical protein
MEAQIGWNGHMVQLFMLYIITFDAHKRIAMISNISLLDIMASCNSSFIVI